MSAKSFYLQLLLVSAGTAAGLFLLNQIPKLAPYEIMSWLSLGLFIFVSIFMYNIGVSASKSDNKYTFTNTIMGFTVGKLFLAIMVILAYNMLAEPATKFFIIPFFAVYFIFTAFETYFLMKLSKASKN
ncbi:MAG: hypothetical protein MRY78_03275 [Saprospiraceae bacterium]|nr:hypothetical protein [Saprospiraceae bacterium]